MEQDGSQVSDLAWVRAITARAATTVVRLDDLRTIARHVGVSSSRPDGTLMETSSDLQLYRAYRDSLPPRQRLHPRPGIWRADVVAYEGIPLPNGEPCRSVGHWNPPDQIEAFEVLRGRVAMIVLDSIKSNPQVLSCEPGVAWILPPGSFHLTYATEPSVVINIYNAPDLHTDEGKYERGVVPAVRLLNAPDGSLVLTGSTDQTLKVLKELPPSSCLQRPISLRATHGAEDFAFASALQLYSSGIFASAFYGRNASS